MKLHLKNGYGRMVIIIEDVVNTDKYDCALICYKYSGGIESWTLRKNIKDPTDPRKSLECGPIQYFNSEPTPAEVELALIYSKD